MRRRTGASLLALLLAACGADAAPDAPPSGPPQRVLAASSGTGDLVCALLPPARIAGLPAQMRDYSGRRADGDPFLGRPAFAVFAAEEVLALRPDLVVADRWGPSETVERLREAHVPVLVLERLERLDDVRAALGRLGPALGAEAAATALLAELDARLAALRAAPGRRAGLRALAYTNGGTGGWVAGAGTSADEWLSLAGLVNVAGREGHARFGFEELLLADADVLVVPGADDPDEHGGTAALLAGDPQLAGLRARRRGLVVELPAWLFSTNTQHIVTAAEELARRLDRQLAEAPW